MTLIEFAGWLITAIIFSFGGYQLGRLNTLKLVERNLRLPQTTPRPGDPKWVTIKEYDEWVKAQLKE